MPHAGDVMLRVYAARIGVARRSVPSRKNVRFSGNDSAKRLFTSICGTSASICEKSGLSVPSMVSRVLGLHFMSSPRWLSKLRVTRSLTLAVEYGATVRCPPVGKPSNPESSEAWQRKQLEFLGIGVLA